jgi:hypothetical protein
MSSLSEVGHTALARLRSREVDNYSEGGRKFVHPLFRLSAHGVEFLSAEARMAGSGWTCPVGKIKTVIGIRLDTSAEADDSCFEECDRVAEDFGGSCTKGGQATCSNGQTE